MPPLLQICTVVVTIALVALALVTIRAIRRFEETADAFSKTAEGLRVSINQIEAVTQEVRSVVMSLADIAPAIRRTSARFEAVAERTTNLTHVVLDEIERPIHRLVALARGVRSGVSALANRLRISSSQRRQNNQTTLHGGYPSVRT